MKGENLRHFPYGGREHRVAVTNTDGITFGDFKRAALRKSVNKLPLWSDGKISLEEMARSIEAQGTQDHLRLMTHGPPGRSYSSIVLHDVFVPTEGQ